MAPTAKKTRREEAAESLGKAFKVFADTMGDVMEDPEVRTAASQLADKVMDAAAKIVQSKVEDKQVRARIRTVGEAAETLGKSIEQNFTAQS